MLKKIKNFVFSKRFLFNLIALIAVYFIVVKGMVWYLNSYTNHGEKVTVPNLVGKNANTLNAALANTGLTYEILDSIYEPSKIEGTILSQDPLPSEVSEVSVKEGRIIRLRVSKRSRMVEVPKCVDKSQRFAESILRNTGLKYRVEYKPTTEADGAVMQQLFKGKAIAPKTKIPIGSTIQLIVGRNLGGEMVEVPNLVGLTISEAKARLNAVFGLSLLTVCEECVSVSDSLNAIISSQNPAFEDGVFAPSGSTVTIFAKKQ